MMESPSGGTLVRTVRWRRVAEPGTERADLWQEDDGWKIEGSVEVAIGELPRVRYIVRCSADWGTRTVSVRQSTKDAERALELTVDGDGRWSSQDGPLAALEGCRDVDLEITPATNTLPIRRLNLEVGQSAEITAAWVRFPTLAVIPTAQRYTRLGDRRYRYQSGTFQADLDVDDLGLVLDYSGIWERDVTRPD